MSLRDKVMASVRATAQVETERYGVITIQELTLAERSSLHAGLPKEIVEFSRIYMGRLIALSVIDEDGKLAFTKDDELTVAAKFPSNDGEKLIEAINTLSRLSGAVREEKKTSSETTGDEGSSSDSALH